MFLLEVKNTENLSSRANEQEEKENAENTKSNGVRTPKNIRKYKLGDSLQRLWNCSVAFSNFRPEKSRSRNRENRKDQVEQI